MKESRFNVVSSVVALILGAMLSFVLMDLVLGEPEDVTIKTIDTTITSAIEEPDVEIFNTRAIDPIVEVFVGGDSN